ncbi:hypothetical protein ACOME3_002751 [Neoechinorhynchus agilis]
MVNSTNATQDKQTSESNDQDKAMSEWKRRVSVDSHIPKEGIIVMNRVFVKGIPKKAVYNDVYEAFSRFGSVTDVNIIHDEHGYSKGFGFITFDNTSSALKALKHEKPIKINGIIVGTVAPAIKKGEIKRSSNDLIDSALIRPGFEKSSPTSSMFHYPATTSTTTAVTNVPTTFYLPFPSAATSPTSPILTIPSFVQFQSSAAVQPPTTTYLMNPSQPPPFCYFGIPTTPVVTNNGYFAASANCDLNSIAAQMPY